MPLLRRPDLWLPPLAAHGSDLFPLGSAQPRQRASAGSTTWAASSCISASYALLCALWWRLLRGAGVERRRAALLAFAATSLYAVSDELHQSTVEGRHGTPLDWAIDSAGRRWPPLRLGARRKRAAA